MSRLVDSCRTIMLFFMLAMMISVPSVYAAMDASFELDPRSLGVTAPSKRSVKSDRRHGRRRPFVPSTAGAGVEHTIRPGDNLFKILMRDYGLSNGEAESVIEVICRENGIADIRHLRIGQKIVIPPLRPGGKTPVQRSSAAASRAGGPVLRLDSPTAALSESEAGAQVRQVWDRLMPPPAGGQKPVALQSPTFSLTLDPQRYPVYAAMDNGRILVDGNAAIPPLVKALISEKDPSVRIVSGSPRDGKRFLAAMLGSAGFYSVEEDFSMEFGENPRLTVHSDFKIEKSPESVINHDLVLMNAGQNPLPTVISDFLKKEGFTVYEPFASPGPLKAGTSGRLHQVTSKKQPDMVDALLSSLSITPDRDRRLDVFAADNNGISLSVTADRYFESVGQRYVVAGFDGDPVAYTLYRILETKGFRVALLDPKDDFRKLSEKLLACLRIPGVYALHTVIPDTGGNYSLQMSGFKLENPDHPVNGVFLTDLVLDRVISDILTDNGYSIISK